MSVSKSVRSQFVSGRRLLRLAAAVSIPQLLSVGSVSAQRPGWISSITEINDAPAMAFTLYFGGGGPANWNSWGIYEAENSTYDADAEYTGVTIDQYTSSQDVNSIWNDVPQTYEFFVGDDGGNHCAWAGIYVSE